jgi:hypothetical protein
LTRSYVAKQGRRKGWRREEARRMVQRRPGWCLGSKENEKEGRMGLRMEG